jgi:hypothetical protein
MRNMLTFSSSPVYLGFATHRTFRRLVHVAIIAVTSVSFMSIFIVAFQCPKIPSYAFSAALLRDRGAGHCFDLCIVFYWQAGRSIGSDIVILLMPMPVLCSLRMRAFKRLSIITVFAVSMLIPIASGVRLWAVNLWANSGPHAMYYGGYIIFWYATINTDTTHVMYTELVFSFQVASQDKYRHHLRICAIHSSSHHTRRQ